MSISEKIADVIKAIVIGIVGLIVIYGILQAL